MIHYMQLTSNDIPEIENKFQKDSEIVKHSNVLKDNEDDEDDEEVDIRGYNPSWTLRKCCSTLLDKLSNVYHKTIFEVTKPIFEHDMQDKDWIVKERSILALGAVGPGIYTHLKPYLSVLCQYLVKELEHPNRLVRAITLWTLSR